MSDTVIQTPKKPKSKGIARAKLGALLSIGCIVFAVSPFFLGVLLNSNAAGWFMIATIPLGVLGSIFGLVWMMMGIIYCLRQKAPSQEEDAALRSKVFSDRAVSLALLLIPLLITQPFLAFVLGGMLVGGDSGLISILGSSALLIVSSGLSLFYAIKSKIRKIQIIIGITTAASISFTVWLGYLWFNFFIQLNQNLTTLQQ